MPATIRETASRLVLSAIYDLFRLEKRKPYEFTSTQVELIADRTEDAIAPLTEGKDIVAKTHEISDDIFEGLKTITTGTTVLDYKQISCIDYICEYSSQHLKAIMCLAPKNRLTEENYELVIKAQEQSHECAQLLVGLYNCDLVSIENLESLEANAGLSKLILENIQTKSKEQNLLGIFTQEKFDHAISKAQQQKAAQREAKPQKKPIWARFLCGGFCSSRPASPKVSPIENYLKTGALGK